MCQITDDILKVDFDAARILYNKFVSAMSFKPTIVTALSPDTLEKNLEVGATLDIYEVEGPDRSELLLGTILHYSNNSIYISQKAVPVLLKEQYLCLC